MKLSKEQLIELLRDMISQIETDDSMEGYINYEAGNYQEFLVKAFYRTGNSMGQGGSRIVQ